MKMKIFTSIIALFLIGQIHAQKKVIKSAESAIQWTGKKITGQHSGTLNFESGFLTFEGDELIGGTFIVNMTSLSVTDLETGKGKEKLEGHLGSDDFFGIKNYPKATLVIKETTKIDRGYNAKGDLTIKGKTNPIAFDLSINGNTASTTLIIDRTTYDIKYGSGSFFDNLGDKAIDDQFELRVDLKM